MPPVTRTPIASGVTPRPTTRPARVPLPSSRGRAVFRPISTSARRGHGMRPLPTTQPATPRPNQFQGSTQQGLDTFRNRFRSGHRGPILATGLNQRSADLRARLEAQMRARQQAPQPVFRGHGRGRLN